MPLKMVAVPIGSLNDISQRARESLKSADVVIGEERKEVSKLLRFLQIENKEIETLNEHTQASELAPLLELCRTRNVALVSDCGTPGFCDPGADLVRLCRQTAIAVSPIPGASSLMCLLSVCGVRMDEFLFRGFLPAENEARKLALGQLERELTINRRAVILLDTPYRLGKLLSELAGRWPRMRAVIGCDFTQETEQILEDSLENLRAKIGDKKAEFILAILPTETARKIDPKSVPGNKHRPR